MIIVVTGLPRSGTTLAMRMLYRGGVQVVANLGFKSFEDDRPPKLPHEDDFLLECDNKAIKILDPIRHRPPYGPEYKFIMMMRNPEDIAKSQVKFMFGRTRINSRAPIRKIKKATYDTKLLLDRYPCSSVLVVRFEDILEHPKLEAFKMSEFLGMDLDIGKMIGCVHDRKPECLPYMAEFDFEEG